MAPVGESVEETIGRLNDEFSDFARRLVPEPFHECVFEENARLLFRLTPQPPGG